MQNTQTTPKIYVACLAAYTEGMLHGRWIEANQEALAIHKEIQEIKRVQFQGLKNGLFMITKALKVCAYLNIKISKESLNWPP